MSHEIAPIQVPREQIESLYRLALPGERVNWDARYRPNRPLLESLVPSMTSFLDENIRKITYSPHELKAVVGMSGGVDSATTATLAAETMRQALARGTATKTSLVLMTFKGMSVEDYDAGCQFAEHLVLHYPELPIALHAQDLSPYLKLLDGDIDQTISSTRQPKVYTGGLTTRFIALQLMEYADRTGHCALDTTNGTEMILGEIVLNGGGECAPLADLYKSQVYDIAEFIGVPDFIINRPPINSTLGNDKVATYFSERPEGITPRQVYQVLDPILHCLFDKRYRPRTVARRLGHSVDFINRVSRKIEDQEHRRNIPYFAFNDRYRIDRRANLGVSNREMLNALGYSLAIGG